MKKVFLKVFLIVMIFIIAGASTGSISKDEPGTNLPTPSPLPGPGTPMEMHPKPDAVNVPLNTSISVYFPRAGNEIGKLDTKPEVEIGNVTTDRDGMVGARYTFYPARPLRSNTTYTVTVTTIWNGTPTNSASWQFTTETAKTPRAVPGFGIAITVMAIFLGIGWKYLGKRQDGFASGVNSSNGDSHMASTVSNYKP